MDVCGDGSVQQAVDLVYQKAGTIDVLINNAGLAYVATVEDMTMERLATAVRDQFLRGRACDPGGAPENARAALRRIIMISSVSGLVTPPTQGAYSASKHAMEGLSNALRHELYPFEVKTI